MLRQCHAVVGERVRRVIVPGADVEVHFLETKCLNSIIETPIPAFHTFTMIEINVARNNSNINIEMLAGIHEMGETRMNRDGFWRIVFYCIFF